MAETPRDDELERLLPLLERRAAELDDAAWLSPQASRRALRAIEEDARRQGSAARPRRWPRLLVPLAVAAALIAFFAPRWLGPAARPPEMSCRWLDPEGRELASVLRGGAEEPPALAAVLLELATPAGEDELAVRVLAFGADGRRVELDNGQALALAPGASRLVLFPLAQELGAELVLAVAAFRDADAALLPDDLAPGSAADHVRALERWASGVARAGGFALLERVSRASR